MLREECPKTGLGTLTGLFGYSRQSFYNGVKEDEFAENALEPLIVEKARDYRKDNPGLGCAKLYLVIKKLFEQTGCMPGRDAFIELLRQNGLMVQIKRRRHYKTTDSSHHYHKYENLIKEIVPSRPNEIWVSDITYVETEEGPIPHHGCLLAHDSRLGCRTYTRDCLSIGGIEDGTVHDRR